MGPLALILGSIPITSLFSRLAPGDPAPHWLHWTQAELLINRRSPGSGGELSLRNSPAQPSLKDPSLLGWRLLASNLLSPPLPFSLTNLLSGRLQGGRDLVAEQCSDGGGAILRKRDSRKRSARVGASSPFPKGEGNPGLTCREPTALNLCVDWMGVDGGTEHPRLCRGIEIDPLAMAYQQMERD